MPSGAARRSVRRRRAACSRRSRDCRCRPRGAVAAGSPCRPPRSPTRAMPRCARPGRAPGAPRRGAGSIRAQIPARWRTRRAGRPAPTRGPRRRRARRPRSRRRDRRPLARIGAASRRIAAPGVCETLLRRGGRALELAQPGRARRDAAAAPHARSVELEAIAVILRLGDELLTFVIGLRVRHAAFPHPSSGGRAAHRAEAGDPAAARSVGANRISSVRRAAAG